MLLTITNTQSPATDLGYLLHKNPGKLQTFDLSFGKAHVFYPEATPERCTAALLLDVDPIGLARDRKGPSGEGFALGRYVTDRPYAASSFLSVAIARVLGSALAGRSRGRQELADSPLPLVAEVAALPCRGGERFLRSLFEPLGYAVTATCLPLDERFPAEDDPGVARQQMEQIEFVRGQLDFAPVEPRLAARRVHGEPRDRHDLRIGRDGRRQP